MNLSKAWLLTQFILQRLSMAIIIVVAIAMVFATLLSAFGVISWLQLSAVFGGVEVTNAGMIAQIAFTVLMLILAFFVPSTQRVMRLETSHRQFNVDMQDIARAYTAVHAEDRAGSFRMASEFDSVRDRLSYLREHPDLAELEPGVLEIASKMSFISRELAETYSDEKVARARKFLQMRQEEMDRFKQHLERAKTISHELQSLKKDVDLEEDIARSQLADLKNRLAQLTGEVNEISFETPQQIMRDDGTSVKEDGLIDVTPDQTK